MDDHFDIARVFEIGKFDIMRLTCISLSIVSTKWLNHSGFMKVIYPLLKTDLQAVIYKATNPASANLFLKHKTLML